MCVVGKTLSLNRMYLTLGVDHSVLDVETPTLIGQQLAKSAINRRAISDNKEEFILFKQNVFPTTHILLKKNTEY